MTITRDAVTLSEFEELDDALPEGFTAELINGRAVLTHLPNGNHSQDIACVADQVYTAAPGLWLYAHCRLVIGASRENRVRADGAVAPWRYLSGQPPWADPSGVLLILEVTSGSEADAEVDRVEKRDVYAETGIPVYLLIDRQRRQVVVHWAPVDGQYTHRASVVYGEKLALPEPFNFDLETADLK